MTNNSRVPTRTLTIGFYFGGGTVLEMARSGTDAVDGVVSFHGDLVSPTLEADAGQIQIPQLILHGADEVQHLDD